MLQRFKPKKTTLYTIIKMSLINYDMYDHFNFPKVVYGWFLVTVSYLSLLLSFMIHVKPFVALRSPRWHSQWHTAFSPQTASSRCVPWTGTRPRSSSGRPSRGSKGTPTHRESSSRSYRCPTALKTLHDYTFNTRSVLLCSYEKIMLFHYPACSRVGAEAERFGEQEAPGGSG